MLLTITATHTPATDLGFLLGKHPERVQTFDLNFGKAHVFYPIATEEICTVALLLDIDPIRLVRGKSDFTLSQYVNDRPYVASSFFSVAIAQVFSSALNGRSTSHAALAQTPIPLEASISILPSTQGEDLLQRLFIPLGYEIDIQSYPLDEQFPEWGTSQYFTLTLRQTIRLCDLLSHLYVLIPVLDNEKHYYVGDGEVQKLLDKGGDWLKVHPESELITKRYLKYMSPLVRSALHQLAPEENTLTDDVTMDEEEAKIEKPLSLHQQRLDLVLAELKNSHAQRILDLGCGEGRLLKMLWGDKQFTEIVGMNVSLYALDIVQERLDRLPEMQRKRVILLHGSLLYRDKRLQGYDAAAIVEVIEHFDPPRLAAFERAIFEFARPNLVIVTTPNAEYNVMWESLPAGKFRHRDHRFEWGRTEFQAWANQISQRFGYDVRFLPIGEEDSKVGAPSQMAIFKGVGV